MRIKRNAKFKIKFKTAALLGAVAVLSLFVGPSKVSQAQADEPAPNSSDIPTDDFNEEVKNAGLPPYSCGALDDFRDVTAFNGIKKNSNLCGQTSFYRGVCATDKQADRFSRAKQAYKKYEFEALAEFIGKTDPDLGKAMKDSAAYDPAKDADYQAKKKAYDKEAKKHRSNSRKDKEWRKANLSPQPKTSKDFMSADQYKVMADKVTEIVPTAKFKKYVYYKIWGSKDKPTDTQRSVLKAYEAAKLATLQMLKKRFSEMFTFAKQEDDLKVRAIYGALVAHIQNAPAPNMDARNCYRDQVDDVAPDSMNICPNMVLGQENNPGLLFGMMARKFGNLLSPCNLEGVSFGAVKGSGAKIYLGGLFEPLRMCVGEKLKGDKDKNPEKVMPALPLPPPLSGKNSYAEAVAKAGAGNAQLSPEKPHCPKPFTAADLKKDPTKFLQRDQSNAAVGDYFSGRIVAEGMLDNADGDLVKGFESFKSPYVTTSRRSSTFRKSDFAGDAFSSMCPVNVTEEAADGALSSQEIYSANPKGMRPSGLQVLSKVIAVDRDLRAQLCNKPKSGTQKSYDKYRAYLFTKNGREPVKPKDTCDLGIDQGVVAYFNAMRDQDLGEVGYSSDDLKRGEVLKKDPEALKAAEPDKPETAKPDADIQIADESREEPTPPGGGGGGGGGSDLNTDAKGPEGPGEVGVGGGAAGAPITDFSQATKEQLDARDKLIDNSWDIAQEYCAQSKALLPPTPSDFDAQCAKSPNGRYVLNMPFGDAQEQILTVGSGDSPYQFDFKCQSRCVCARRGCHPPEAKFVEQRDPPVTKTHFNDLTVERDINYYLSKDEARQPNGGRYGIAHQACYLKAPDAKKDWYGDVQSKCQSGSENVVIDSRGGKPITADLVGEASGALLTFGCQYLCNCQGESKCMAYAAKPEPPYAENKNVVQLSEQQLAISKIEQDSGVHPGEIPVYMTSRGIPFTIGDGGSSRGGGGSSDLAGGNPTGSGNGTGFNTGTNGGTNTGGGQPSGPLGIREEYNLGLERSLEDKGGNKPSGKLPREIEVLNADREVAEGRAAKQCAASFAKHSADRKKADKDAGRPEIKDSEYYCKKVGLFSRSTGKFEVLLDPEQGAERTQQGKEERYEFQFGCTIDCINKKPKLFFVGHRPPVSLKTPDLREGARYSDWSRLEKGASNQCNSDLVTKNQSPDYIKEQCKLGNLVSSTSKIVQDGDKNLKFTEDNGEILGVPLPYKCEFECDCKSANPKCSKATPKSLRPIDQNTTIPDFDRLYDQKYTAPRKVRKPNEAQLMGYQKGVKAICASRATFRDDPVMGCQGQEAIHTGKLTVPGYVADLAFNCSYSCSCDAKSCAAGEVTVTAGEGDPAKVDVVPTTTPHPATTTPPPATTTPPPATTPPPPPKGTDIVVTDKGSTPPPQGDPGNEAGDGTKKPADVPATPPPSTPPPAQSPNPDQAKPVNDFKGKYAIGGAGDKDVAELDRLGKDGSLEKMIASCPGQFKIGEKAILEAAKKSKHACLNNAKGTFPFYSNEPKGQPGYYCGYTCDCEGFSCNPVAVKSTDGLYLPVRIKNKDNLTLNFSDLPTDFDKLEKIIESDKKQASDWGAEACKNVKDLHITPQELCWEGTPGKFDNYGMPRLDLNNRPYSIGFNCKASVTCPYVESKNDFKIEVVGVTAVLRVAGHPLDKRCHVEFTSEKSPPAGACKKGQKTYANLVESSIVEDGENSYVCGYVCECDEKKKRCRFDESSLKPRKVTKAADEPKATEEPKLTFEDYAKYDPNMVGKVVGRVKLSVAKEAEAICAKPENHGKPEKMCRSGTGSVIQDKIASDKISVKSQPYDFAVKCVSKVTCGKDDFKVTPELTPLIRIDDDAKNPLNGVCKMYYVSDYKNDAQCKKSKTFNMLDAFDDDSAYTCKYSCTCDKKPECQFNISSLTPAAPAQTQALPAKVRTIDDLGPGYSFETSDSDRKYFAALKKKKNKAGEKLYDSKCAIKSFKVADRSVLTEIARKETACKNRKEGNFPFYYGKAEIGSAEYLCGYNCDCATMECASAPFNDAVGAGALPLKKNEGYGSHSEFSIGFLDSESAIYEKHLKETPGAMDVYKEMLKTCPEVSEYVAKDKQTKLFDESAINASAETCKDKASKGKFLLFTNDPDDMSLACGYNCNCKTHICSKANLLKPKNIYLFDKATTDLSIKTSADFPKPVSGAEDGITIDQPEAFRKIEALLDFDYNAAEVKAQAYCDEKKQNINDMGMSEADGANGVALSIFGGTEVYQAKQYCKGKGDSVLIMDSRNRDQSADKRFYSFKYKCKFMIGCKDHKPYAKQVKADLEREPIYSNAKTKQSCKAITFFSNADDLPQDACKGSGDTTFAWKTKMSSLKENSGARYCSYTCECRKNDLSYCRLDAVDLKK